ncbi:nucleotide exchange factor GrpE [Desulfosoma sp.]
MKLLTLFRRPRETQPDAPPQGPPVEDLGKLIRTIRRQTLETERLMSLVEEERSLRQQHEWNAAMDAAEAYFYLCRALQEADGLTPRTQQALNMVWGRLERMLALLGLRMVRDVEVPFDPRVHEAVAKEGAGDHGPAFVCQVVQPGFVTSDRVVRHAKVIVSTHHSVQRSISSGARQ